MLRGRGLAGMVRPEDVMGQIHMTLWSVGKTFLPSAFARSHPATFHSIIHPQSGFQTPSLFFFFFMTTANPPMVQCPGINHSTGTWACLCVFNAVWLSSPG